MKINEENIENEKGISISMPKEKPNIIVIGYGCGKSVLANAIMHTHNIEILSPKEVIDVPKLLSDSNLRFNKPLKLELITRHIPKLPETRTERRKRKRDLISKK